MKKIYYVLIAILVVLIITNPSLKSFKEYLGYSSFNGLSRKANFLICSTYRYRGNKYFGIAENFFKISKPTIQPVVTIDSTLKVDSTVIIDSSKMDTAKHFIAHVSTSLSDNLTKVQKLYYNLLQNGVTEKELGTEEQFSINIKNPINANKLYNKLLKIGFTELNLGTRNEFLTTFSK